MDIKILDTWLKDYLDTKASPADIAKYLSLCGPSVERIHDFGKDDKIYDIEVTTNRVDAASVFGIAREAAAILPRFKVPAKLKNMQFESKDFKFVKKVKYLNAIVDPRLCPRFTAVLIHNVKIGDSPAWVRDRLEAVGVRSINNVVDISNFVMIALGQPVHTFDYDKIEGSKMILRESRKGEKITTLDGKVFNLSGGDIVIEDGKGRLIDLAGIMGGNLSCIDENTKNVLLFVQTYDPVRIRKTSMDLAQRTMAATIFEKGTDTELVYPAILSAIHLFEHLTGGTSGKEIVDIYPAPYKVKRIIVEKEFIEKRLGISLPNSEISKYLNSLGFETTWRGKKIEVSVPSFRGRDVLDSEDVVEEIARIYGYHNLPSRLMTGKLTTRSTAKQFEFETSIKNYLSGWGGIEVYTLALTGKENVDTNALKLKNPLGVDTEYMRTSLMPSLISAAGVNKGTFDNFHLFEISNVYLPKKNDLPEEKLMLAGIFEGYKYRNAKGIVEALLTKLNINAVFESEELKGFSASHSVVVKVSGKEIGLIGVTEKDFIYYEFTVSNLFESVNPQKYQDIPKYPAQIEDLTFILPDKTRVGEVVDSIKSINQFISKVELGDIFKNNYTFNIQYQDPDKTLTNTDVEKIRKEIIASVKKKFGGSIKE